MAVTYIPFFHPKIDWKVERYTDSNGLWRFIQFPEHQMISIQYFAQLRNLFSLPHETFANACFVLFLLG
jgi:hypothetical protein